MDGTDNIAWPTVMITLVPNGTSVKRTRPTLLKRGTSQPAQKGTSLAARDKIALAQIRGVKEEGKIPLAPVTADAGYGVASEFREGLTQLGILYMVGIQEHTGVWTPDRRPKEVPACRLASSAFDAGLEEIGTSSGGVAFDRVAGTGEGADEILVFHASRRDVPEGPGPVGKDPLEDREGLRGVERGNRAGPF